MKKLLLVPLIIIINISCIQQEWSSNTISYPNNKQDINCRSKLFFDLEKVYIQTRETSLYVSNIAVVCPRDGKIGQVHVTANVDGNKIFETWLECDKKNYVYIGDIAISLENIDEFTELELIAENQKNTNSYTKIFPYWFNYKSPDPNQIQRKKNQYIDEKIGKEIIEKVVYQNWWYSVLLTKSNIAIEVDFTVTTTKLTRELTFKQRSYDLCENKLIEIDKFFNQDFSEEYSGNHKNGQVVIVQEGNKLIFYRDLFDSEKYDPVVLYDDNVISVYTFDGFIIKHEKQKSKVIKYWYHYTRVYEFKFDHNDPDHFILHMSADRGKGDIYLVSFIDGSKIRIDK